MKIIYETENFILEAPEKPEIDRLEGGHIKIHPKVEVEDRTKLSPDLANELMALTILAGKAMKSAMKKIGVEIERINYQDNGNWTPKLHVHLYGRAKNATMQKYGEPIIPGHKPEYSPLNDSDIKLIKKEINLLL